MWRLYLRRNEFCRRDSSLTRSHPKLGCDRSRCGPAVQGDRHLQRPMRDLTSSVSWESFSPIVATITSGGLATGATPGMADIVAAFDQFDAVVSLNVSLTPGLQRITVSPADSTINPSESVQFAATGVSSDGSISVLTSTVTWTSSRPGVAEMAPGTLATGIQTGSTAITATSGSVSGTAMLSVNSLWPAILGL